MTSNRLTLLNSLLPFGGLSRRKRSFFYIQMAQMLDAGMTPIRGLTLLSGQRMARRLRRTIRRMSSHIEAGGSLSSALGCYPSLFPPMESRMIQAAEYAGALPDTLNRLGTFLMWLSNTIRGMYVQMAYPAILLITAFVFIPVFKAFFLGGMEDVVHQISIDAACLIIGLFTLIVCGRTLMSIPLVRRVTHAFVSRIPVFGRVIRQIARARFSHTLECLYTAGVPVPEALSTAAESCGNESIARRIKRTVPIVQEGNPIVDALSKSRIFDAIGLGVLEVGEQSGKFDEALRRYARHESKKAEDSLSVLARILPVLVYLIVAAYLVYCIILPGFTQYFNLIDEIY